MMLNCFPKERDAKKMEKTQVTRAKLKNVLSKYEIRLVRLQTLHVHVYIEFIEWRKKEGR